MNAPEPFTRLPFANKKLLIFDLDGTIADSSALHARAFNDVFARFGVVVNYNKIAGVTSELAVGMIAHDAGIRLSVEEAYGLVEEKRRRAQTLIELDLQPLDGSIEFIRRARGRFVLSLCTSASKVNAHASLRRLDIAECFSSVFTAEDVRSGKPHPEAFLKAIDCHGVSPQEALVFEDSEAGVAAARAAELDVIKIVADAPGPGEATWRSLNADTGVP